MKKQNKDSATSWEQKSWEFAVSSHVRCKEVLAILKRNNMTERFSYWQERITQLETEYPSLKERQHAK
jgi:hypothetical protein